MRTVFFLQELTDFSSLLAQNSLKSYLPAWMEVQHMILSSFPTVRGHPITRRGLSFPVQFDNGFSNPFSPLAWILFTLLSCAAVTSQYVFKSMPRWDIVVECCPLTFELITLRALLRAPVLRAGPAENDPHLSVDMDNHSKGRRLFTGTIPTHINIHSKICSC